MSQLIPSRFRATITDRFISAFFAFKGDTMIQVELEFDSALNPQIIRRAFIHALSAEPILGCKFTREKGTVYWERIEMLQQDNFTVFTKVNEYEQYRNLTLSASEGPVLEGALLQQKEGDKLLFKIAHEVADAAGAKDVVTLVAILYRQLLKSPNFTPAPNIKSYRSARQLFKWIPKYALPFIWFNALKEMTTLLLNRKACNPLNFSCDTSNREYIVRVLDALKVASIKSAGKKYGATINDVFLAAFLRSIYKYNKVTNANIRCGMTVDLRKWYIPSERAETITNLSNIEVVDIGKKPGTSFVDTLKKIVSHTSRRKKQWIGLNLHCGLINLFRLWSFETMESIFYKQQLRDIQDKAVFPAFTNLGAIDKNLIVFDKPPVSACIIVPTGFPPYFGLGVSGYNETLTITTTVFPQTKEIVEKILDEMTDEMLTIM